jgi:hypothetical protein
MTTRTGAPVLVALLLAGTAGAEEAAAPAASSASPKLRLPPRETFRLFPEAADTPRLDLSGSDDRRLFHQQGDPDSLFTIGAPSPEGEVHLLAAVEINEIFLKAIPPDPTVARSDTRPRAAGSFLPVDSGGRPYQLRLGARLVW